MVSYESGDLFLQEETAIGRVTEFEGKLSDSGGEMGHDCLLFLGPLCLVEVLGYCLAASQGQLESHPVRVVRWSILYQILGRGERQKNSYKLLP